jgi:hypothetical protein
MTEETNKCTACSCEFTDDEGGIHGHFGILPMSFCPTCLSCMLDMAEQLNPKEWVGLTNQDLKEMKVCGSISYKWVKVAEEKLKELNT